MSAIQHAKRIERLEAQRTATDDAATIPEDIRLFYGDPLAFVMHVWDWPGDPALQLVKLPEPWALVCGSAYGPDAWACQFLEDLGAEVQKRGFDGRTAVDAIRMAAVSGHGIGKSCLVAWLVIWIMATRPHARGTVTAATGPQLESRTWPEIVKWLRRARPEVRDMFEITSGRGSMRLRHRAFPESWFTSAQTCDKENSEAFAGQHAANSTSFYIFDETSGIDDSIDEVSEGGLSDGEPMKFCFGNGTRNTGFFFDIFHKWRHRWDRLYQIDSRSVQITNKRKIAQDIEDHGENSDWVKRRWRGMFPSAGDLTFFSRAEIDAAMQRPTPPTPHGHPVVMGVDVARRGGDSSVLTFRHHLDARSFPPIKLNGLDLMSLAARVAAEANRLRALGLQVVIMVDGTGLGAGVVDRLRQLGFARNVVDVQFAARAPDPVMAANLRAWMHLELRLWLRKGGALVNDQQLADQMAAIEFGHTTAGAVLLEKKDDLRERIGCSPDELDSLCCTFAAPVTIDASGERLSHTTREHDPYETMAAEQAR